MKVLKSLLIVFAILLVACGKNPQPDIKDEEFVVKFIVNNEVISEVKVKKGESAACPKVTPLEGDKFIGWDSDFSCVTSNLEVKALFEKEKFVVKFIGLNGKILKEELVEYGKSASAPNVENSETHRFIGWDKDFSLVKGDLEVRAQFEEIEPEVKKYTVIFFNYHKEAILTVEVEENGSVTAPVLDEIPGLLFTGWDEDLDNITSDTDVYAQYEVIKYSIKFMDGDKELKVRLKSYTVLDGVISLPDYEKTGYTFIGWFDSPTSTEKINTFYDETGDKVFYGRWEEIPYIKPLKLPDDCTFLFKELKKVLVSGTSSTYVYQPSFNGLDFSYSTSSSAWTWSSLNPEVATISQYSSIAVASSGYAIIKAVLNSDPTVVGYAVIRTTPDGVFISSIEEANTIQTFKVTFLDEDGETVICEKEVLKGGTVEYPEPLSKSGKVFIGWDKANYNIESDTIIKASYIDGNFSFSGKTVSFLGDSISTFKGYVPSGYACFYPYPTADVSDYNQTWWMQVANNLGMKLLKNNSWSGSCVSSGTGSSSCVNDSRLKELLDGNVRPDVIVIFMGSNDCGSKNVKLSTFDSSYKTMLTKIIALAPNADIYVSTLPPSGLYTEADRIEYNEVIRKYAKEFNVKLIESENIFAQSEYKAYVVDSAHYNRKGMNVFAQNVIKEILKCNGVEYTK